MLAVVASQDISNLATPPTNEESKWAGSKAPVDINLQQAGMTGASTACHWPPRGCPQALCLVGSRGLTELARTLPSLNFGSNKLIWAGLVPMERYDRSHKEQGSASVQCQDRKPGTVRGTRVLICYPSNGLARGILGCPRYPTQPYWKCLPEILDISWILIILSICLHCTACAVMKGFFPYLAQIITSMRVCFTMNFDLVSLTYIFKVMQPWFYQVSWSHKLLMLSISLINDCLMQWYWFMVDYGGY